MGFGEVLLIVFIAMLVFGAPNLGKVGSGIGEAIANFKRGLKGDDKTSDDKKSN